MEHGRHSSKPRPARARARGLASTAALLAALAPSAAAAGRIAVPEFCETTLAAVLDDIARRDLDTAGGPPLNAFLTLNPNALAQAQALDREIIAGNRRGPLLCVPVAMKDNFDTYDMPDVSSRPARLAGCLHLGPHPSGGERRGMRGGGRVVAAAGAAGGRPRRWQSAQRCRHHGRVAARRA